MERKIIISVVVGSILCLGLVGGIVTSIINKNNGENANKELQERIDFVNNTYNDMKDTKSTFYSSLNELNEKNELFKSQIEEIENSIDTSNGESYIEFLELQEDYYFFESNLEELNNKYAALDTQLTDITTELSDPDLDFNNMSYDVIDSLNNWNDDKAEITERLRLLTEKADSIETLINQFDIAE